LQIEILSKKELVNLVLKKHSDLMDRYTREYEEIRRHEGGVVEEIEKEKRERSGRQDRREVLEEKKKLLLYQAEILQKQMFEALLQTETGETKENLVRTEKRLEDKYTKLKKAKDRAREEILLDEIRKELKDIPENDKIDRAINLIEKKLNGITASETELQNISSVKIDEPTRENRTEMRELGERKQWLERRTNRHKEALAYWENEKNNIGDLL